MPAERDVAVGAPPAQGRAPDEVAAAMRRLRAAEAHRDVVRASQLKALGDRDRARERARLLAGSESYRLGRALVSLVKNPARTVRRLAARSARRLYARLPGPRRPVPRPAARRPASGPRRGRLYVAWGLDLSQLRELVLDVARYAQVTADHRPVVVTDCPDFALLRNLGVVLEYVPDRETWARHRPEPEWATFRATRLAHLLHDHRTDDVVVVDPDAVPDLATLLGG